MTEGSNNLASIIRFVTFSFLILLNGLLVIRVVGSNDIDFRAFYSTGALIREGNASLIYHMDAQSRVQGQYSQAPPLPFRHPAYEGLLFAPLSLLSYNGALAAWILLNVGFLAVSCVVLRLNGIVFLLFAPIAFTMALGQDSLLLMALIAVALRLMHDNRDGLAGAVLALGLFRFHVVLPFVGLLLLGGRKRLAGGFAVAGALVLVWSLSVSGIAGFGDYLHMMGRLAEGARTNDTLPTNMPTLRGLSELVLDALVNPGVVRSALVTGLWGVAGVSVIWKTWPVLRRDPGLAFVASLLVLPYGYAYDLAPVALLARDRMSWPLFLLAFTPLYLALGAFAAVSLMALPLAALLVAGQGSTGFQIPSLWKR